MTATTMWWRVAFVVGAVAVFVGGGMHPDSPAELSLREELALMTADDAWVPGHLVLTLGIVAVVAGLVGAWRARAWPTATRILPGVIAAAVLLAVESVVHTAAALDRDALAAGDPAPVAFTHIGLAAVAYPLSGIALVVLALRLAPAWSAPQRALAVAGVVGGAAHAASVPVTLVLADTEVSFLFAVSGVLLAVFFVALGLVGVRSERPLPVGA